MQKGGGSGIEIDDLKKVFSIVKDKTKSSFDKLF